MIEKNELHEIAQKLGLNPETVEKDYVLGWLLYGIDNSGLEHWIFKGGTSLKKCYFDTFRFSEDLDFTLTNSDHFSQEFLLENFYQIADLIYEETGIEFSKEKFTFKIIPKSKSKFTAQGKIHYNGPIRRTRDKVATIKLDLTCDEIVILPPVKKQVIHLYSDSPTSGIWANCYAFEEVIAEKVRALGQRARPRDLYDVIHFFRNRNLIENPKLVCEVLKKKCSYKNIPVPNYESIEHHEKIDELEPQWSNMLAHQLPNLPPLEAFWQDLKPFFDWLAGLLKEQSLKPFIRTNQTPYLPKLITNTNYIDINIERIKFAAANRLCLELTYNDKARIIEPLSFRISKDGNKLLYGYEPDSEQIKAFSLSKIQHIEVTNTPYFEREYPIEINATGTIVMPPIKTGNRAKFAYSRESNKHTIECTTCGKKFRRTTRSTKLNKHKNKLGYPCYGKVGYLIY